MAENFNAADVLVTAANILYAPLATALPDETTVAWNDFDAWTGWEHLGYTASPTTLNYSYEVFALPVEQSTSPVIQRKINEQATIDMVLSQFSDDNIALLTDGTITVTAPGASQKGFSKIVTGGSANLPEYMLALEGYRPADNGTPQPIRVFFYRTTIRLNGGIPFNKAGGTTLPAQATALLDSAKAVGAQLMEIHIVTAPASS
jgi:hypothetical protein